MSITEKKSNIMQSEKKESASFQELGEIVEGLLSSGRQMMAVMNKQTKAIISSEEEKLENYTEEYTNLRGRYDEQEQKFVKQLRYVLGEADEAAVEIRLGLLKKNFPEASHTIDEWRSLLRDQARVLKKKNERVAELLEFALNRNAELMYSIYNLNNRKNTHYGSAGQKEEISSGIAINKEA